MIRSATAARQLPRRSGHANFMRSAPLATSKTNSQREAFKPPQEQSVGDGVALVLTAFHEIMQPILTGRCFVNVTTGTHKRSITNRGRSISDNIKPTTKIFERIVGNPASVGNWFALNHVGYVIRELLLEAAKGKRGRWQWEGFWLYDWEMSLVSLAVLRAYIAGAVENEGSAFDLL